MLKKSVPLMLLAGLFVLGVTACGGGANPAPTATSQPNSPSPPPASQTPSVSDPNDSEPTQEPSNGGGGGTPVTVALDDPSSGGEYAFEPAEFTFEAGETVTFTIEGGGEYHTFTVDELGIDQQVNGGETVTVTQTFDEPGTYQLICIPHEALGMVGTITVE